MSTIGNRDRKLGECVYCGERGPVTRDHIPPRNLFPQPRPSDLITVPACDRCNSAASLDDEHFRLAITAGIDPGKFPNEFDLSLKAINKLSAPEKRGLARTMLSRFSTESLFSPAGLYLGKVGTLSIDAARIRSVVSRVVRGLFFHHFAKRLPSTHAISIVSDWLNPDLPDKQLLAEVQMVLDFLSSIEAREVGSGVLSYRYRILEGGLDESVWWLSFYDHRRFLCWTHANDSLA